METCDKVVADMAPYMLDAEVQGYGTGTASGNLATGDSRRPDDTVLSENRSTRVTALPARSENSWEMIMHEGIMEVGNALLGCAPSLRFDTF